MCNTHFTAIILTECWLGKNSTITKHIDGYNAYCSANGGNRNSGTVIFLKDECKNVRSKKVSISNATSVQLDFEWRNREISIIGTYRSPKTRRNEFIDTLGGNIDEIDPNRICLVAGDMNLDIHDSCTDHIKQYHLDTMAKRDLVPCIKHFTRVIGRSQTTIDHIFLRSQKDLKPVSTIWKTNVTDHFSTILQMNLNTEPDGTEL